MSASLEGTQLNPQDPFSKLEMGKSSSKSLIFQPIRFFCFSIRDISHPASLCLFILGPGLPSSQPPVSACITLLFQNVLWVHCLGDKSRCQSGTALELPSYSLPLHSMADRPQPHRLSRCSSNVLQHSITSSKEPFSASAFSLLL